MGTIFKKKGITLAILNLLGTTSVDNEQLNIHSSGLDINVFNNFKIVIGYRKDL